MKKLASLLAVAGLVLAACSAGTPAPKEVTLQVKEFSFDAPSITVKAGQPVKLTLRNAGTMLHDFSIMQIPMTGMPKQSGVPAGHDMGDASDDPQLHVAVEAGQTATLEFTPSTAGTYEFFCSVSGHKEAGMMGKLVVEP